MIEDGKAPCVRCGVMRYIQYTDNRTGLCKDCHAGRYDGPRTNKRWMDAAACTQVDPEIWFPAEGNDEEEPWRPNSEAKRICAACPVAAQCLADAPAWDRWSIRAGLTAAERRRKVPA